MAITATAVRSNFALNVIQGTLTDTAATPALYTVTCGFVPRKVVFKNLTDRTQYEWTTGNANGTALKTVAAGTVTLDTADVSISVDSALTGTAPVQFKADTVITFAAAIIIQNKVNEFEIYE